MIWIQLIISAALIVYAGVRLTTHADILSDRLNLGKVWIGIVLLGVVTSLPELVATFTAVISLQAFDLAVGNILGSNNFNPMMLVIMDALYRQEAVTNRIHYHRSHALMMFFTVTMTLIVILQIAFRPLFDWPVSLGNIAVMALYLIGIRMIARQEELPVKAAEAIAPKAAAEHSLAKIAIHLVISAMIVAGAAVWLTNIAEQIAQMTGLGETFVGTIVLAVVTSLPELVVCLAALKLGAFDMAVGNIFGSNMINLFFVPLCDLIYPKGPILMFVSKAHVIIALSSILLALIALWGFKHNRKRVYAGLGADSWLMLAVYLYAMTILYQLR